MEVLKTWGASLCCAAAACAILQFLAPKDGNGSLLEMIGAAVFLCCALTPLVKIDWQAVIPSVEAIAPSAKGEVLAQRLATQLEEPVQKGVQEQGAAALARYGLEAKKICAVMDIDADANIYISEIVVTLAPEQAVRRTSIKQILEQRFQVDVRIEEERFP